MENKFTALNFMRVSGEVLDFQLRVLYPVNASKDPTRVNLVFLNHDRNYSTFLTIRHLVEHERVSDIYTLSRSMFESVVPMGLLTKGLIADDIERYQEFQHVEIYKTYSQLKKLGLQHLSGLAPFEAELISKKRSNYIKRWGKSTLSWTGKSLEENVKLVDEAYPPHVTRIISMNTCTAKSTVRVPNRLIPVLPVYLRGWIRKVLRYLDYSPPEDLGQTRVT